MSDWYNLVQGSEYSFSKELFAAIDSDYHSYPPPFNGAAFPIMLRMVFDYKLSPSIAEFFEGMTKRYEILTKQTGL